MVDVARADHWFCIAFPSPLSPSLSTTWTLHSPLHAPCSRFPTPSNTPPHRSRAPSACLLHPPTVAVAALQRTIQLYKEKGKFRQAADREKEIAVILAQEGGDLQGALEAYEQAGDLYSSEDAQA